MMNDSIILLFQAYLEFSKFLLKAIAEILLALNLGPKVRVSTNPHRYLLQDQKQSTVTPIAIDKEQLKLSEEGNLMHRPSFL
jgi:hypothetical protein